MVDHTCTSSQHVPIVAVSACSIEITPCLALVIHLVAPAILVVISECALHAHVVHYLGTVWDHCTWLRDWHQLLLYRAVESCHLVSVIASHTRSVVVPCLALVTHLLAVVVHIHETLCAYFTISICTHSRAVGWPS